jgi:tRNA nucleotidyltransferase (CCA-adding enzyme)
MPDFVYMLETRLSPEQQGALRLVQQIARDHGMNVYLTGGAVRDFFTGSQIRDLDFSVQGNALALLKDLEKAGAQVQGMNEALQVLYMLLPGRVRAEIASTRTERYEKPSKPEIAPATIVEDLRRRDFTANAMALSLNPGSYALFMDPLNGVADIEARVLRIVHNYGFYEEPSRMIRAVRFMSRFGWTMEERTQTRYQSAKENEYINAISKAALGYELEQIFHEPDPLAAMRALDAEGYLKLLYPGWTPAKVDEAGLARVAEYRDKLAGLGLSVDPSTAFAEFLTKRMPEKDVQAMQKMMPRKGFVEAWRHQEEEAKELAKRLTGKEAETPSQIWKLLMACKPETILYLAVTTKQATVERKLEAFFQEWPTYRQKFPYAIMTEMRITPELPVYQQLLDDMFLMMIDGKLQAEQEIRAYLEPHSPPLPAPPPSLGRRRGKKAVKAAVKKAAPKAEPAAAVEAAQAVVEKVAEVVGEAVAAVKKAAAAVGGSKSTKPVAPAKKQAAPEKKPAAVAKTKAPVKKIARKVDVATKLKRKPAPKKAKAPVKAAKPKVKAKAVSAKKAPAKKAVAKKAPAKAKKTVGKKTAKRR